MGSLRKGANLNYLQKVRSRTKKSVWQKYIGHVCNNEFDYLDSNTSSTI